MKMRKPAWRNAAYEYIKQNGPCTTERLLESMKTKQGRLWNLSHKAPKNASGASQLLRVDPRFEGRWVKKQVHGADGSSMQNMVVSVYNVMEWRLADEESQTDTE